MKQPHNCYVPRRSFLPCVLLTSGVAYVHPEGAALWSICHRSHNRLAVCCHTLPIYDASVSLSPFLFLSNLKVAILIRVTLCKVSYRQIWPLLPPLWRHRSKIEQICSSLLWENWGKSNFLRRLYASQKSSFYIGRTSKLFLITYCFRKI